MLAVAAAALGIQGSAVQRFGVHGLSSTYLTGTLTTVIGSIAARQPLSNTIPSVKVLLSLVLGSGVGAVCTAHIEPLSPFLLVVPLGIVVLKSGKILDKEADRSETDHSTRPPNPRGATQTG